jgi:hypothetical protein
VVLPSTVSVVAGIQCKALGREAKQSKALVAADATHPFSRAKCIARFHDFASAGAQLKLLRTEAPELLPEY